MITIDIGWQVFHHNFYLMLILYIKIKCGINQIWCYQNYLVIPTTRRFPDVLLTASALVLAAIPAAQGIRVCRS
jgi:hypothetical protein